MSRNGSGVYSLPSQYLATTGETITALQHNLPLTDIAADLNAARPVSSGGTGASTAATARDNLGLKIGTNVQAYSETLTAMGALSATLNGVMVGDGTTWVVKSGSTLLTAIGAQGALGFTPPPNTRTISAGGLATGGGDLSADRTITVTGASQAEAQAGTDNTHVMTPLRTKEAIDANATDLSAYVQFYTGSTSTTTTLPIGASVSAEFTSGSAIAKNASSLVGQDNPASTTQYFVGAGAGTTNTLGGTWRSRGVVNGSYLMQRTA